MKRLLTAFLVLFSLQVNAQDFQESVAGGVENRLRYLSTDSDTTDSNVANVFLPSAAYVDAVEGRPYYYQINKNGEPLIWAEVVGVLTGTNCVNAGAGCSLAITKVIRSSQIDTANAEYILPDFESNILIGSALPADRIDLALGGCDGVILAGQSNMVGWASAQNIPDPNGVDAPSEWVYQWGYDDQFISQAIDPLQHPQDAEDVGVGLGVTFGKTVQAFTESNHYARVGPTRPICLIPVATGATGITARSGAAGRRWWNDPVMFPPDGGVGYQNMFNSTQAFLSDHPGNRIIAILWHQGEEDARTANAQKQPNNWADDVSDMFTTFRAAIPELATAPIIYGSMLKCARENGCGYNQGSVIQAQIESLGALLPFSCYVDLSIIPDSDEEVGEHASAAGYRQMGDLYKDCYLSVTGQTATSGIPTAPTNVSAEVTGNGLGTAADVTVCWNTVTATPSVTSYSLYEQGNPTPLQTGILSNCAAEVTGLTLETPKTYEVTAFNGQEGPAGSVSLNTGNIPQTFVINTPTSPANGQVDATWTDPLSFNSDTPVLGCTVQYKLDTEPTIWTDSANGELPAGTEMDTVTGLSPVLYNFRVVCRSGIGDRISSNTGDVTPLGGDFAPPAPGSFTSTNAVQQFDLSWIKPNADPDITAANPDYRLFISTNAGPYIEIENSALNGLTAFSVTVASGDVNTTDTFEFQLRGDNSECVNEPGGVCAGAFSGQVSLNVPPPTGLVATSPGANLVDLNWNDQLADPACDASGNHYEVQIDIDGGGYNFLAFTTASELLNNGACSSGELCTYQVRCTNGNEDANSYATSNSIDPDGGGGGGGPFDETWGLTGITIHSVFDTNQDCGGGVGTCLNGNQISQWYSPGTTEPGRPPGNWRTNGGNIIRQRMEYETGGYVRNTGSNQNLQWTNVTDGNNSSNILTDIYQGGHTRGIWINLQGAPTSNDNFFSFTGSQDTLYFQSATSLCMGAGGSPSPTGLCSDTAPPTNGDLVVWAVNNGLSGGSAIAQMTVFDAGDGLGNALSDTSGVCSGQSSTASIDSPQVLCTISEGGYWAWQLTGVSAQSQLNDGRNVRPNIGGWASNTSSGPGFGCEVCEVWTTLATTDGGSDTQITGIAGDKLTEPTVPQLVLDVIAEMDNSF